MAFDTVIDKAQLEAAMKATADAIREKTGDTANCTWDPSQGFAGLIAAIESGGSGGGTGGGTGGSGTGKKDVTFIDYDGTILHSYSLEEMKAMKALPPLPSHDGLICQGWNYDLETIQSYDRPVTVGAVYITDDGKTRIYIHLEHGRTSPMLGCYLNGTVTVDWGDGTEPDTLTGTSVDTSQWTPNHNYAGPGDYVIALTVKGAMAFFGSGTSDQFSGILRYSRAADSQNRAYQNAVQKVEIGDSVTSIDTYAFNSCHSLASITIPEGVTSINDSAFNNCYSLASITIPKSVTSIGGNAFRECHSLASITIPEGVTSIGGSAFMECHSLASITIPEGVTSIGGNAFQRCYSLASITIPKSVTSIGSSAFYGCYPLATITIPEGVTSIGAYTFGSCYSVRYYDFTACTKVPTLASFNAFLNIPTDCEMLIPAALYDEWRAATNWTTYAKYMVAV